MVTIKITNKAWSNQSKRLALAAAGIVLTSFPAERQPQCPGKRSRKCNQSHHALWGQEEPRRGCSLSLRGTWALLHVSLCVSTEDRSYTLAPSSSTFFFLLGERLTFLSCSFRGFYLHWCGNLGEACSFSPTLIWIQAVLLCPLVKDNNLVNYPKSISLFWENT